ncbi:ComEA family DNA-binding protein [Pseudoduganella aquatica]|nr:helix-hairpin-helix domain-containing protein [Pseudoduganella aquatica]
MTPQTEALRLLEESLSANEAPKGSLLTAVQKLSRAAALVENDDIQKWCSVQLGDQQYTRPLQQLLDVLQLEEGVEKKSALETAIKKLKDVGLNKGMHYSSEEVHVKIDESAGGYHSIGFIEERYADLVRLKNGNDGTYYKNNLNTHLSYVRRRSHELASGLLNRLRFVGLPSNCFDVLRSAVDDKLLDLNPALAEQLMLAFKAVASAKSEEWSQALTTCRRLLEGLADVVYPANSDPALGRVLSQAQYVNRLWAFMDKAIESDSNKALAKVHVDFLGAWMEKTNKIANKGVHAEVGQLEAVKAVFHTYLVVADILEYTSEAPNKSSKPNINNATMDELEALLNISRSTAKEIVKARVAHGKLDAEVLKKVPGVGAKTIEKALTEFSF